MNKYRISQAQLDTIAELKNKVGDVRLADLLPAISLEQVCMSLTDEQIEDLLHEKINNIEFYAHYNLAGRGIGWNFESSTKCTATRPVDTQYSTKMKKVLEQANPRFKLIIDATKTANESKRWPYQDVMNAPIYGNIICYDNETGTFRAMNNWVNIDCNAYHNNIPHTITNKFAAKVIRDTNFRAAILKEIHKTL